MPAVLSAGQIARIQEPNWWPITHYGSLTMYNQYTYDYAALYRTQPNVRTCVDFLARNIAQLGLHVFRRVSETDRVRLRDHPLAVVLGKPLPAEFKTTRYRLIEALVSDLGVYFNAYWLKIRRDDGEKLGLLRIPPPYITPEGGLLPTNYVLELNGVRRDIPNLDIVHIRGYNPENPIEGLSPLETLRRVLAEEHAASDYREHFWRNSARMNGIILRPASAPEWSDAARTRFKAEFEALYTGAENSGRTAILEEDMKWQATTFNAQESEYLAGRKLTREECARAYHIPLPMVGILDNATFSNIKEQHKNLYQDSLGPWLAMIEQDIELQLLPEFEDSTGVYAEFNIQEKLSGSFEEQTAALQSAVGRPWMTANEARARHNMPSLAGDADELVTPLNVLVGGQASPRDSAPPALPQPPEKALRGWDTKALSAHVPDLRARHEEKWREVLTKHYRRQEAAIIGRVPETPGKADLGGVWYDQARWNEELYRDLLPLNKLTAETWGELVYKALEADVDGPGFSDAMLPYLQEHSRIQSEYLNGYTMAELEKALRQDDPKFAVKEMFLQAASVWAVREATTAVTAMLNFGATEGARASGVQRKTWQVNSDTPRDSHLRLDGETVGIRETFSNGLRWPGDPRGGAEENANCMCSVRFE